MIIGDLFFVVATDDIDVDIVGSGLFIQNQSTPWWSYTQTGWVNTPESLNTPA